jgi:ribosomal protein S12 methylthiotransferase
VPIPERVRLLSAPGSAYVRIADGCDNRCSFCAIPLIRGPLVSRPQEDIIAECRALLKRGIVELCLVAQDLASYGTESGGATNADTGSPLAALLDGLSAIPGGFWVRLLYLHPDRFPLDILGVMARDARFLPYFDIPFQHAAPSLLRAMGRRGDRAAYLGLIAAIRAALPDAVIRSTFMTGFPGETDADFEELLRFQDEARLDWLGVFAFSREEGVPAYSMPARPSRKRARERKNVLEERQMPISEARAERFVGRRLPALVEERTGLDGLYLGRLFCHAPEVDGTVVIESAGPLPLGAFAPVAVTGRAGIDLRGHSCPISN